MVAFLLAWLTLCIGISTIHAGDNPIGVCDLVKDPARYDDRVVTTTGEYVSGKHGAVLVNEHCGFACRYPAFGMGAAVDVEFYNHTDAIPSRARGLLNVSSIRAFHGAISKAVSAQPQAARDLSAEVTFVGVLKVARNYTITASPDGGYVGSGYGFMGRYSAQLLVLAVKSYRIREPGD